MWTRVGGGSVWGRVGGGTVCGLELVVEQCVG